jgi:hypothetical protein
MYVQANGRSIFSRGLPRDAATARRVFVNVDWGALAAANRDAPKHIVQETTWRFARRWSNHGVRIAGPIEAFSSAVEPTRQAVKLLTSAAASSTRFSRIARQWPPPGTPRRWNRRSLRGYLRRNRTGL